MCVYYSVLLYEYCCCRGKKSNSVGFIIMCVCVVLCTKYGVVVLSRCCFVWDKSVRFVRQLHHNQPRTTLQCLLTTLKTPAAMQHGHTHSKFAAGAQQGCSTSEPLLAVCQNVCKTSTRVNMSNRRRRRCTPAPGPPRPGQPPPRPSS